MFAKVFGSLWTGSMVGQSDLQLVFVFLLARCDSEGFVDEHPRVIASLTGIPLDRVETALRALEAPDDESRTPDLNGRRIMLRDDHRSWGWSIVNYAKYRAIRDEEVRKEQNREATRGRRERLRESGADPSVVWGNVSERQQRQPTSAQAEAEGEGEEDRTNTLVHPAAERLFDDPCQTTNGHKSKAQDDREWVEAFNEYVWPLCWRKVAKAVALKAWVKIPHSDETLTAVCAGMSRHAPTYLAREMEKRPHLATYLNARRWEDPDA